MLSFPDLVQAYLSTLHRKPCYPSTMRRARQWIVTLTESPTRREVLDRHRAKGRGDFQPGCATANKELLLLRTIYRWGLYEEQWDGPNPTEGIKPWRTHRRKRVLKFLEIKTLLYGMDFVQTEIEKRDRALIGLIMFTGCRPSEGRKAERPHITPYGSMGCWLKPNTKTGQPQELPLPHQVMRWLADLPEGDRRYFSGQSAATCLSESSLRKRWAKWRAEYSIHGFWTYDFRRTLATYLSSELKESDSTIQAILNHYDGRALAHYNHHPFDALAKVIQSYADWLFTHKGEEAHHEPAQSSLPYHLCPPVDRRHRVRTPVAS